MLVFRQPLELLKVQSLVIRLGFGLEVRTADRSAQITY